MSRAGEEDDDEEGFHDSLDRLLSSSNTSCSCSHSNSEDEDPNCNYCPEPVPRFPKGLSNKYDVWIAQPSSVEERRIRLLRQMGLTKDPSLLRHRPSLSSSGCSPDLFKRSASSDHLNTSESSSNIHNNSLTLNNINSDYDSSSNTNGILSGIVRSKSDGGGNSCKSLEFHIINSNSSSPGKEGIIGTGLPVKTDNQNHSQSHSDVEKSSNGSPMISSKTPNMPPKREIREDSMCNGSFSSSLTIPRNGESEEGLECNKLNTVNGVYMIKNLDNGKEFVVKEVREDGMWKKIKEVGTGRQLTMEEFSSEMCVGTSPIVQELMRRQNVEDGINDGLDSNAEGNCETGCKLKRGSWLKSIKNMTSTVTGHKERRSSDERDTSSEKGGRRSSSATDDSQDVSFHVPERVRIRQYGKSVKELTGLYKIQEIQAHRGSIWTIKFSLDGKYLATAGEDCAIHVWQVVGSERKGDLLLEKIEDGNFNLQFLANGSPEPSSMTPNSDNFSEKKRRGKSSINRKSASLEQILVPETVFALLEKPICSFQGHLNDVLDLSWSKSQQLLSSSMDKTVRLWDLSSNSCLKIFAHSDYVTCIQFNPVDDRYFISGSLDAKVRIWSIPDHQVVDWNDLHEMVTAACYTPDGQSALVGSYKGSCFLYDTSDNKFQQKSQIDLLNKKKSHQKKITGFQFAPGSTSEVLITSGDSRVRVIEGIDLVHKFKDNKFQQKSQIDLLNKKKSHQKKITGFQFAPGSTSEVLITSGDSRVQDKEGIDLVHKFKGFRNTNSQISASLTTNGKYVISASEDSYVYIWRHEGESRPNRNKGVTVTHSYEHFHCQDVSVAIPWPGMRDSWELHDTCFRVQSSSIDNFEEVLTANHPPTPVEEPNDGESSPFASVNSSPLNGMISSDTNSYLFDRFSVMWSEDKFISATKNTSPQVDADLSNWLSQNRSAWGMVIVTAGLRGEIRTFQNFGLPLRN